MELRRRLKALEARHSGRGGDLPPLMFIVHVFGPDDAMGPPGEYRHTLPDGREYVCKVVDVFAEGGAPCDPE